MQITGWTSFHHISPLVASMHTHKRSTNQLHSQCSAGESAHLPRVPPIPPPLRASGCCGGVPGRSFSAVAGSANAAGLPLAF